MKKMTDLFKEEEQLNNIKPEFQPLANRLRPKKLDEIIGQQHLFGKNGAIVRMIRAGRINSLIFWGPPGTGKTSLARLLAKETDYNFVQISAIFSTVNDLKKIFEKAKQSLLKGKRTLLFVDEIHRFNRAQLDSFLPVMEDGTISLLGATTQNPSFELNSALLSRAQVLIFNSLTHDDLAKLLERAQKEVGRKLNFNKRALLTLFNLANGDGRALLLMVEDILFAFNDEKEISDVDLVNILQKRAPLYDKNQDGHYNLISALHKSIRGSDPDAALYYFSRMVDGGEDILFLARRLIRMASEDIGLADPNALNLAIAARDAYQMLGSPEGELALAQLVIYLALAPKSNAAYLAFKKAMRSAKQTGSLRPPKTILNAPTKLMKQEEYGKDYIYDHDTKEGFSGQNYFPIELGREHYYSPQQRGFERELQKRLDYFATLRAKKQKNSGK